MVRELNPVCSDHAALDRVSPVVRERELSNLVGSTGLSHHRGRAGELSKGRDLATQCLFASASEPVLRQHGLDGRVSKNQPAVVPSRECPSGGSV